MITTMIAERTMLLVLYCVGGNVVCLFVMLWYGYMVCGDGV